MGWLSSLKPLKRWLGTEAARTAPAVSPAAAAPASARDDPEPMRKAGNAALAAGRLDEALAHYERYAAAEPAKASAHVNRAFVLLKLGRLAESEATFRHARELDLANHETAFFLGQCLEQQQRWNDAAEQYRQCATLEPAFTQGWLALARLHEQLGAVDAASDALRQAVHHDAAFTPGWHGLTRLALQKGEWAAALAAADQHLLHDARDAQLHGMRSEALRKLKRAAEALASADAGLALQGSDARLWRARGLAEMELKRIDAASTSLRRALELNPGDPEALAESALPHIARDEIAPALELLDEALRLAPDLPAGLQNKALALTKVLRFDEAIALQERALAHKPGDANLRFDHAMSLLSVARWDEGWRGYEWRLRLPGYGEPPLARRLQALEPGANLAGRHVMITVEQGLGDTLQFLRYIPTLIARGARVSMTMPERLRGLLPAPWHGCQIVSEGDQVPADLYSPLMSLPHRLPLLEPLGMREAYVTADAQRLPHWHARLSGDAAPAEPPPLRVGLAWAGNPDHPDDARRSLPLEALRTALVALPGVCFVSLQLDVPTRDAAAAAAWPELLHVGREQRDMADTAALVCALDLVITVDTSIAHLVGALHRPLWLLLQHCPDWRWGLHGEQTPWYPTARLWRQPAPGDWAGVLQRLPQALREFGEGRPLHASHAPEPPPEPGDRLDDPPGMPAPSQPADPPAS